MAFETLPKRIDKLKVKLKDAELGAADPRLRTLLSAIAD